MRVITWNMQGATGSGQSKWVTDLPSLFTRAEADIVCLQECGQYPPCATPIAPPPPLPGWLPGGVGIPFLNQYLLYNIGHTQPYLLYILWMHTDPGGNRTNLAICSPYQPINFLYAPQAAFYGGGGVGNRPAIGIRFSNPAGGFLDVYTLHATSRHGAVNDSPGLIANINGVSGGTPWFTAGDFNLDPGFWPAGTPVAGFICNHVPVTTHSGSATNLDYAVKNPGPAVVGHVLTEFVVSDHFPVIYDI